LLGGARLLFAASFRPQDPPPKFGLGTKLANFYAHFGTDCGMNRSKLCQRGALTNF